MTCERAVTPKTIEHQHALVKTLQHAVAVAHGAQRRDAT